MFASAKGKQQKKVRQLQCQEQCIDHIPHYLSVLLRAHFSDNLSQNSCTLVHPNCSWTFIKILSLTVPYWAFTWLHCTNIYVVCLVYRSFDVLEGICFLSWVCPKLPCDQALHLGESKKSPESLACHKCRAWSWSRPLCFQTVKSDGLPQTMSCVMYIIQFVAKKRPEDNSISSHALGRAKNRS